MPVRGTNPKYSPQPAPAASSRNRGDHRMGRGAVCPQGMPGHVEGRCDRPSGSPLALCPKGGRSPEGEGQVKALEARHSIARGVSPGRKTPPDPVPGAPKGRHKDLPRMYRAFSAPWRNKGCPQSRGSRPGLLNAAPLALRNMAWTAAYPVIGEQAQDARYPGPRFSPSQGDVEPPGTGDYLGIRLIWKSLPFLRVRIIPSSRY